MQPIGPSSFAETPKRLSSRLPGLIAWVVMLSVIVAVGTLIVRAISAGLNDWEHSRLGPLQRAACGGDLGECERLVKSGIAVDSSDDDGVTALDWAVFYCRTG